MTRRAALLYMGKGRKKNNKLALSSKIFALKKNSTYICASFCQHFYMDDNNFF